MFGAFFDDFPDEIVEGDLDLIWDPPGQPQGTTEAHEKSRKSVVGPN